MARRAAPRRPNLVESVERSIAAMTWLTPSDQTLVDLARAYAHQIEEAALAGDDIKFKMLGWIGPHLTNTLKALGGTPAERKALGVDNQVRGKLAELRAARSA